MERPWQGLEACGDTFTRILTAAHRGHTGVQIRVLDAVAEAHLTDEHLFHDLERSRCIGRQPVDELAHLVFEVLGFSDAGDDAELLHARRRQRIA